METLIFKNKFCVNEQEGDFLQSITDCVISELYLMSPLCYSMSKALFTSERIALAFIIICTF